MPPYESTLDRQLAILSPSEICVGYDRFTAATQSLPIHSTQSRCWVTFVCDSTVAAGEVVLYPPSGRVAEKERRCREGDTVRFR
jgi:hypothetical protein